MSTKFVLRRIDSVLEAACRDIGALVAEEASAYEEGRQSRALVNRYERDPALRAAAIRAHGLRCQGCGFSFADVYGARGEGYIEVHHLRPLASYGGVVKVDPVHDMAAVCANCHRMIHRDTETPLTLDELRVLVAAIQRQRSLTAQGGRPLLSSPRLDELHQ